MRSGYSFQQVQGQSEPPDIFVPCCEVVFSQRGVLALNEEKGLKA